MGLYCNIMVAKIVYLLSTFSLDSMKAVALSAPFRYTCSVCNVMIVLREGGLNVMLVLGNIRPPVSKVPHATAADTETCLSMSVPGTLMSCWNNI